MPSQYGEHVAILKHFKGRVGRFLDVGAFDGITFSNTRYLAELGWSGACVEPSPIAFRWLMQNYLSFYPSIEFVNAAIGTEASLSKFWVNTKDGHSADAMSSFEYSHVCKFADHPFREMWCPIITWDLLLQAHPGPYDFVNIDVEGMNEHVLSSMPLQPQMVCVEIDPADCINTMKWDLKQKGLPNFLQIGGNLLAWS